MLGLHTRQALAISVLAVAGLVTSSRAQQRGTTAMPRSTVAVISTATVIALTADTAPAGLAAARAAAEGLGFTFVRRTPPLREVVDQGHAAIYYVPRDLEIGYFVVVPGRRPDVVRGLVSADTLRTRILAYLRLHRELVPGSQ